MKRWHVYEDWTLEEVPRCFYVGKGNDDRVSKPTRNKIHSSITSQFGYQRVIVETGDSEEVILEAERRIIAERHTYVNDPEYNGIGCNKTRGGQGNSGRIVTQETREKISKSKFGKKSNKVWTQEERDATSQRMRDLHRGKKLSESHINVLRNRMADYATKQDMIEKVTATINAKYQNDVEFYERIVQTRARGESSNSPFTEDEVRQMRKEWDLIDKTIKGNRKVGPSPASKFCHTWAKIKGVSNQAVYSIVTRKSWKHIT